jgi:hypothetical protein
MESLADSPRPGRCGSLTERHLVIELIMEFGLTLVDILLDPA